MIELANNFNIATLLLNIPEETPAGVFILEPATHNDIALALHTSGSTGLPKAVHSLTRIYSHQATILSAHLSLRRMIAPCAPRKHPLSRNMPIRIHHRTTNLS